MVLTGVATDWRLWAFVALVVVGVVLFVLRWAGVRIPLLSRETLSIVNAWISSLAGALALTAIPSPIPALMPSLAVIGAAVATIVCCLQAIRAERAAKNDKAHTAEALECDVRKYTRSLLAFVRKEEQTHPGISAPEWKPGDMINASEQVEHRRILEAGRLAGLQRRNLFARKYAGQARALHARLKAHGLFEPSIDLFLTHPVEDTTHMQMIAERLDGLAGQLAQKVATPLVPQTSNAAVTAAVYEANRSLHTAELLPRLITIKNKIEDLTLAVKDALRGQMVRDVMDGREPMARVLMGEDFDTILADLKREAEVEFRKLWDVELSPLLDALHQPPLQIAGRDEIDALVQNGWPREYDNIDRTVDVLLRMIRRMKYPRLKTLRAEGLALAKELRDYATSAPPDHSPEIWNKYFYDHDFFERLEEIKSRLESVLGEWKVEPGTKWRPSTREAIMKMAESLERESLQVQDDVPL